MTPNQKVLAEAKQRRHTSEEYESTARANWLADVKFGYGDDINRWQWDEAAWDARTTDARPCLTINKVRQHVLQIVNDARQNKAAIKITPTGGGATYQAAQIFAGICRHIEYQSNATAAYDTATWNQVTGGIGYWRVVTRYVDEDSMDQELFIQRIPDALSVYLDPEIQQYDGSDARYGFVDSTMDTEAAEREHPEIKGERSDRVLGTGHDVSWHGKDRTRVVEYYRRVDKPDRLHVLPNGSVMRESEADDRVGELGPLMLDEPFMEREPERPVDMLRRLSRQSRTVRTRTVEWYKIVGDRVVDKKDTVFDAVPIVRVVGEETVLDGKLDRKGHVRAMRDAQRIYNYWNSSAIEFVALQGKSPFIATAQSIEGHENLWETANTENHSVLTYNGMDEQGRVFPKPERAAPPVMAAAFLQGVTLADQQMMMVSGQYQSELGRSGNETSGVAIQQRQRQGDTATYHYIDHLAQAIRFTGRLIVRAAPKVYDTPRVIKIMARDGTMTDVNVDPSLPDAHEVREAPAKPELTPQGAAPTPQDQAQESVETFFNPGIGRYEVEADVGPSFGTQRQEAFSAFREITAQNPQLIQLVGDLMFQNADFPGADEIAERLKRMLPPAAMGRGPSPEMQQLQQQMQTMVQQGQGMAQQADQEIAELKRQLQDTASKLEIEHYKAETARLAAVGGIDPAALRPIIRGMVSEMLGQPALPIMQQHAQEDVLHQQALDAGPPGVMGQPGVPEEMQGALQ